MITEKLVMFSNSKVEDYIGKWEHFKSIYDFMGPDMQIIQ